jgi:exodeoxyribonuclease VII small subunit
MTKQAQSYQELHDELESVLAQLQSDDVDIDAALKLYEKGQALIAKLEARLAEAEHKITELTPKRLT